MNCFRSVFVRLDFSRVLSLAKLVFIGHGLLGCFGFYKGVLDFYQRSIYWMELR